MSELGGRQKGLMAVAGGLLAAAAGVWYFWGGQPAGLPGQLRFVCVATGEQFTIDRRQVKSIPMVNPKTGEATLLPVYEEDGKLMVTVRHAQMSDELSAVNRFIDRRTREVRPPP